MKDARIMQFGDCFITSSSRRNRIGLVAVSPPYQRLPLTAGPQELAEAVLDALEKADDTFPPRRDPTFDHGKGLLKLARVRSWSALAPVAECGVTSDEGLIKFVPLREDGGGGYEGVPRAKYKVAGSATLEEIGRVLVRALQHSQRAMRRQGA